MTWSLIDDWWSWDPWGFGGWRRSRFRSFPALNVYGNEEKLLVTSELSGLKPEDLTVEVHGRTLTIKGERKEPELGKDECYTCQERNYGEFERHLNLPYEVDAEKIEAKYENGVLVIHLPRREEDKPRKVPVKAA